MRIAVFSDVHSNLPALDAVLADIAAAGVDARYALGDLVGDAPWPNEVLERLRAEGFPYDKTVAGTRFINVGAAGKPKDGDPRACWTLIETSASGVTVEFRRVAYDIESVAWGILASELPHEFVDQLREARGFRASTPA